MHRSSVAEKSYIELVLGMNPNIMMEVPKSKRKGNCLASYKYATDREELLDEMQNSLRKTKK